MKPTALLSLPGAVLPPPDEPLDLSELLLPQAARRRARPTTSASHRVVRARTGGSFRLVWCLVCWLVGEKQSGAGGDLEDLLQPFRRFRRPLAAEDHEHGDDGQVGQRVEGELVDAVAPRLEGGGQCERGAEQVGAGGDGERAPGGEDDD